MIIMKIGIQFIKILSCLLLFTNMSISEIFLVILLFEYFSCCKENVRSQFFSKYLEIFSVNILFQIKCMFGCILNV